MPKNNTNRKITAVLIPKKKKKSPGKKTKAKRSPQKTSIPPSIKGGVIPKLSKCGLKYLAACTMPFSPMARGACVPQLSAMNSIKTTTFTRFDLTSTAAGTIWIAPIASLASDGPVCMTQTPTAVDGNFIPMSGLDTLANGGAIHFNKSNPYTSTQLTLTDGQGSNVVVGRVVSMGVRVTYVGTTLNMSGVSYTYSSLRHENMAISPGGTGSISVANVASFVDTRVESVSRKPVELALSATLNTEREYSATEFGGTTALIYPFSISQNYAITSAASSTYKNATTTGGINIGCPTAVIVFTGLQNGATLHVEIIQHLEYSGILVDPIGTPSTAHVDDMATIASIVSNLPKINATEGGDLWSKVKEAAMEVGTEAIKYAIPAAKKSLMAMLA